MANIKFRLGESDKAAAAKIYFIYWITTKQRLIFPTGLKIAAKYWNNKTNRVRDLVEATNKDLINNRLSEIEAATERYTTAEKAKGNAITKEGLRAFLLDFTTPKAKPTAKETDFLDFVKEFAANAEKRTNPATGVFVSRRTVQEYRKFSEYINDFCKEQRHKYTFSDIDLDFYKDFTEYLQRRRLAVNTIGKIIKDLKAVLNEATAKGINTKTAYKSPRFKVVSEESENVYLNETELKQIADLDLLKNKSLDRVRDLFLLGCWTGLRFSDFTQITAANIHGGFIDIEQQKTGKKVVIPIHPTVAAILQKYNNVLPRNITNQKFNEYLKEVCRLADIAATEQKRITKGGLKAITTAHKWQLISTHTARRSFATNLYLSGFPALSIMQITGHRTEKAFMRYIKVNNEQHANLLRNFWAKNGEYIKKAK